MRIAVRKCLVLLACLLVTQHVFAERLTLNYGVNRVDINGDDRRDMIIKSRWQNFNAHSFDRYLILLNQSQRDSELLYYEVPLGDDHSYAFTTSEGADCFLRDYLFEVIDEKLAVTEYRRPLGEHYLESHTVTITRYTLYESETHMVGVPPAYLKEMAREKTAKKYCDVRELIPE